MRSEPAERPAAGRGGGIADPRALAVFFVFFAQAAAFASWLPRLPELKAAFGLSEGALGALLMALPAGAIVAAPLAGLATARASPRALNVAAMACLLAAIALIGAAPGPVPLAAVLLLVGLGGGVMGVVMNAAGLAVEEELGRPILSRCHALYSVGLATGALLAGVFLAAWASILAHLATVASVILVAVLAVARWLPGRAPEAEGDAPRFAWPSGALLVPAAVACGCLLAEGAAVDWSAVYLDTVLSAPAATVGLGVAAFSGAMALVRFGGDRLTERLGERRLVTGGAALAVAGFALVALAPDHRAALGGFLLAGLGLAPIVPTAFRIAGRLSPRNPGLGVAAASSLGYAGFLLGPALVGLMAEAAGLRLSFAAVAGLLAAVALLSRRMPA